MDDFTEQPANRKPASFLQGLTILESKDPAADIPGMPRNFGQYTAAHTATFQSFYSSGARVYREYDEAVRDNLNNARYMRNDCGIMECLEARQRMVALLEWHLEPENEQSHEQKDLCEKLTKIIQRIHKFTEYRRVLQEAIWYGKAGIQHRFGWVNVNGVQRQLPKPMTLDDPGWKPINGDKLVYRQDRDDLPPGAYAGQLGIRVGAGFYSGQQIGGGRWQIEPTDRGMAYFLRPFERETMVVHRHMIEDAAFEDGMSAGSLYGVGIRSRIYWEWVQKQESLGFLMEYLERSAGGVEIWTYPSGNDVARQEMENAAKNRARGQNVLIVPQPMGDESQQYGVQVIEPGLGGIEAVKDLVENYFGHRVKRYILGQVLSSEAAATGLGSGVADLHLDTLMQIIRYDATNLEETLTYQLVDFLQRLNFPESAGTLIRFKIDTESPDVEKKLQAWQTAYEMGCRLKESDVMGMIGASIPGPKDRALVKQEPQQMQQPGQIGGQPGTPGITSEDHLAGAMNQEMHNQMQGAGVGAGFGGGAPDEGDGGDDDGGEGPDRYGRDFTPSDHPRDPENGQFVGDDDDDDDSEDSGDDTSNSAPPAISSRGNMEFEDAKTALLSRKDGQVLFQSAVKNGEIAGKMTDDAQRQSLTKIVNLMLSAVDKKTKLAYRSVMRHFEGHRLDDQIADEDPELFDELQADGTEKYAKKHKPADGQGRFWVTIGGGEEGEKKHVGGTPVQIDGSGNIHSGPDALRGKNLDKLDGDKQGAGAGGDEKAGEKPAADTGKPMSYKEFIASGRKDSEWDAYRDEQNKASREKSLKDFADKWRVEGVSGNSVVNNLRAKGVEFSPSVQKALQHDDTSVSSTEVSGRGMSRAEAKKIHGIVSQAMLKHFPAIAETAPESADVAEQPPAEQPSAPAESAPAASPATTPAALTAALDAEFSLARQSAAGRKKLEIENNDANKQGALFIGKDDKPGQNYLFGNVQSSRETAGNDLEEKSGGDSEQSAEHPAEQSAPAAEEKPTAATAAVASTQEESTTAPAATAETPSAPRSTLDTLAEHQRAINSGEASADQVRQWFDETHSPEFQDQIRQELSKKKIADLKQMRGPSFRSGEKKSEIVDDMMNRIGQQYAPGKSLSFQITGDYHTARQNALRKAVSELTDEDLQGHASGLKSENEARAARRSQIMQGIENPQTLQDFQRLERVKEGYHNLSPEHQAQYDHLAATERRKGQAAKAAEVKAFSGGEQATGGIGIVEGHHQKRNAPTHTVTVENRLGEEGFSEALRRAKQLGGSYVNARIAKAYGATPGFQFFDKAKAEQFADVLRGQSVDRSADLEQRKAEMAQQIAENLMGRAGAIQESAEGVLNADRKTNTARRADMASGIEGRARQELAKANTIKNISDAMSSGQVQHLSGLRHATQVDTLDAMLRRSRSLQYQDALKNDPQAHHNYEDFTSKPHGEEDIPHVEFPYPRIWSNELQENAKALADVPGLKNIGKALAKRADITPKFSTQGNGFKFSGGRLVDPHADGKIFGLPEGKMARVHQTHDYRLSQQSGKTGPFYTADSGKTFSVSPEMAVRVSLSKGNQLDMVDAPRHEMLTISDPQDLSQLKTAVSRLRKSPDRNLQRIGERLADNFEHLNRLEAMDIKSPAELRAALREYLPHKAKTDREDPVKAKERALVGKKIEGFFPTPRPLVDRMLESAQIEPGHSVLEPSAGKGDILDAIRERAPEASTTGIEPHSDLRDILASKGHTVGDRDFLQHTGQYDRIVMNPPFERGQDMEHVQHAYKQLKPGGRMVAIMSEGPFSNQNSKASQFRDWLDSVGGEHEQNPQGSFAGSDAFRQTGTNTRMVTIEKPTEPQKFSRRLAADFQAEIDRYYRSEDSAVEHPDDHGITFAEAPSHPPAKNKPGWQHVGGSSVFVNADGKITKGCPGLKGEHVSDLIDESDESRDERDARQAHAKARGLTGKDLTGTEAKRLGSKTLQAQHQAAKEAAKSSGVGTHHVLRNLPEAHERLAATGDPLEPARARARQLTGHNTRTLGAIENRGGGDSNSVANLDVIGQQLAEEFPELGWDMGDDNSAKVFDLIRQGKSTERIAPHSPEVAAHAAELAKQDRQAQRQQQRQAQKPTQQRAPLADPIAEAMQQAIDEWQPAEGDEPEDAVHEMAIAGGGNDDGDEWSMGESFQQRQHQEEDAVPF